MNLEVVPRRLTRVCWGVAVFVLAAFGVLAVLLPRGGAGGQTFGPADQIAFFGLGVLLAGTVLAFTRFRVRADQRGIWVRNVLGERFFPWELEIGRAHV